MTVMLGMPGSGKSTWAAAHAHHSGARLFTTDPIRIDNRNVVSFLQRMTSDVDLALAAGDDVVIDACNVNTQHRLRWLRLGRRHGARCVLALVATDPAEAMARNERRPVDERVPADRMESYARQMPRARARLQGERWDEIVVIGIDQLPEVAGASRSW